jgi:predicted dehydrogenase
MHPTRRDFLTATTATAAFTLIPSWMRAGLPGGSSPNADVHLGMIGCGRQGNGLSRLLTKMDDVRIVAACDVHPAKREDYVATMRAEYAGAKGAGNVEIAEYDDYRALIDHDGLDAVFIATPDHQHAPICIAALERGLHVYCEKPLAHTVEEGRAMVEATEQSGKVLQTGSMQRSMHNFQEAVRLVQAGELGEIKEVLVSIGPPPKPFDLEGEEMPTGLDWQSWIGPSVMRPYHPTLLPPIGMNIWGKWRDYAEFGGGMITDWGAHMFDIVQWALDQDASGPTEFYAPGADADYGLTFFYDNGVRVEHREFGRGNAIRFIGSEGSLDVSRSMLDSPTRGLIGRRNRMRKDQGNANRIHFEEWFAAMRGEGEVSCPAEVGHRTASVCSLANIAYRLNEKLVWDPSTERITNNASANRLLGPEYRLSLA